MPPVAGQKRKWMLHIQLAKLELRDGEDPDLTEQGNEEKIAFDITISEHEEVVPCVDLTGPASGTRENPVDLTKREIKIPKTRLRSKASQPPDKLASLGLTKKMWENLEASRETIPRFLFRCFGPESGGQVDKSVNTTKGIIPHRFLTGEKPTSIYDTPKLGSIVCGHLHGDSVNSCFSSWAACVTLAKELASSSVYVAILDTSLLANHVHIYHATAFFNVNFAKSHYDDEYLAYGPIEGPAFHCVEYHDLISGGFHNLTVETTDPEDFEEGEARVKVLAAKRLAALFRPASDERPDVIIALTAAFASIKNCNVDWVTKYLLIHLASELEQLGSANISSDVPALVNHKMYTGHHIGLQQLKLLLREVEEKVKEDRKLTKS